MRNKEPFGLTSPVVTICTARLYIKKLRIQPTQFVLAFPVILTTSRMVHLLLVHGAKGAAQWRRSKFCLLS